MKPRKFTHDILKKQIAILESNWCYRINDAMIFKDGHPIHKELERNSKYKNTLLLELLKDRGDKFKTFSAEGGEYIYKKMELFIEKNEIPLFDDTHLLIHIRLGDIQKKSEEIMKTRTFYEKIVDKIKRYPQITKIVIVTGLQYGHPSTTVDGCPYRPGKFTYSKESYDTNIDFLLKFIHKMPMPVIIQSCSDVDIDFCNLVFSRHVITTVGGMGKLVEHLNRIHISRTCATGAAATPPVSPMKRYPAVACAPPAGPR